MKTTSENCATGQKPWKTNEQYDKTSARPALKADAGACESYIVYIACESDVICVALISDDTGF